MSDTTDFLSRARPAKAVFDWFKAGFVLFKKQTGALVGLTFVIYCFVIISMFLPVVFGFITSLIMPTLFVICAELDKTGQVKPQLIWQSIKQHWLGLTSLFGFNLIAAIVCSTIAAIVLGDQATNAANTEQYLKFISLTFMLYLPALLAFMFAPAIVIFEKTTAIVAIKQSFLGCFKNAFPLFVFALIALFGLILASMPMGLGLIVFLPYIHCVFYAMYRDIFINREKFTIPEQIEAVESTDKGNWLA